MALCRGKSPSTTEQLNIDYYAWKAIWTFYCTCNDIRNKRTCHHVVILLYITNYAMASIT